MTLPLILRLSFLWAALSATTASGCHREPQGSSQAAHLAPSAGSDANPAPEAPKSGARAQTPVDKVPLAAPATPGVEASSGSSPALGKIYLEELGQPLPAGDLDFIVASLAHFFPNPVVTLPPRPLPEEAYYRPRSRYRAEKILDALVPLTPADAQVIVLLTTVDISTTKGAYEDWGVLGLATISGRECVISRFRATREAKGPEHVRERLAKVVAHEIGHTLGLEHCPTHGCLMEDGRGTVLTTDHEYDFCAACRGTVGHKLVTRSDSPPWARPPSVPLSLEN